MTSVGGWLRKRIFGMSFEEVSWARRGFRGGEAGARLRLEQCAATFLTGYHAALEEGEADALPLRLSAVGIELRGFAFEGAAMGLALLDQLTPWRKSRWQALFEGAGAPHAYMMHVGVGWALARLPWLRRHVERPPAGLDPLLRWLAVDGYGFHEGFFHWRRSVEGHAIPRRLTGYARRAFDQGLGRSLWFVDGADAARIPVTIAAFPPSRQADLWSGVGLACAYAGGADRYALEALGSAAGLYGPELAQGAAFAAKARQRAGNPAPHTELACAVLGGISAEAAATATDIALQHVATDGAEPAYELWRQRIQARFAPGERRR